MFGLSFSWENDLWVTLGDFVLKKRKNGNENLHDLYLAKSLFDRNETGCADDKCNYMSNMCAKEFSDSNFNSAVIGKISIFFKKLSQISRINKKSNFSSIIGIV